MTALHRFFIFMSMHLCLVSTGQDTDWVFSTSGTGNATTKSVFPDKDNDGVYGAGFFEGVTNNAIFGQSGALNSIEITLTANGPRDGMLFKLNNEGEPAWLVTLTGNSENALLSITQLSDGTVLAGGYLEGSASIYRGSLLQASIAVPAATDRVGIICAFDTNGNYLWHQLSGNALESSMVVDIQPGSGFFYALTLAEGSAALPNVLASYSNSQYHLGCYNTDGDLQWENHFGDPANDLFFDDWISMHPRVDHFRGFTAVIGYFNSADFTVYHTAGNDAFTWSSDSGDDLFVLLFDENGSLVWAEPIVQSLDLTYGYDVAVNCEGVYVTGSIHATPSFPAWLPGGYMLNGGTHDDIFVARLNMDDGQTAWATLFNADGDPHLEHAYAIDTDEFGNVFLAGQFHTAFGPGFTGAYTLDNSHSESFVIAMNNQGEPFWADTFSGSGDDVIYDLYCHGNGVVYVGGRGSESLDEIDADLLTGETNAILMALQTPTPGSQLCCYPVEPGTLSVENAALCPGEPIHFDYSGYGEGIHTLRYSADGLDWVEVDIINEEGVTLENPQSGTYQVLVESLDCLPDFSNSVDVSAEDVTPPQLTCALPLEGHIAVACGAPLPDLTSFCSAVDACSDVTAVQDVAIGTFLAPGSHTVWVSISDEAGNEATQPFPVVVEDTAPPLFDCPEDITVSASDACTYILDDFSNVLNAVDNCSAISITQTPVQGTELTTGNHEITIEVTDDAGNAASCTFHLVVEDHQAPALICNGTQVVSVGVGCTYTIAQAEAYGAISENCDSLSLAVEPAPGTMLTPGQYMLTLSASDAHGNADSCTFELIVEDDDQPLFSCSLPNSIQTGDDCTALLPDFFEVCSVTDACGIVNTVQNPVAGTPLPPGDHLIQLQAEDVGGNVAEIYHEITVIDYDAPLLECPSNQNRDLESSCGYLLEDFTESTVIADACGISSAVQTPPPGDLLAAGEHIITIEVTDDAGNSAACSFSLTVSDISAPQIYCLQDPVQIETTDACNVLLPDFTDSLLVNDNCGVVSFTQTPAPDTPLSPGEHTITMLAEDDAGNSTLCSFLVLVSDLQPPSLSCTTSYTFIAEGCGYTLPDLTDDCSFADACEPLTITQNVASGSFLPPGIHEVIITAEDAFGNLTSESISVTINDEDAPVLNCPDDQQRTVGSACTYLLEDFSALLSAEDNCEVAVLTQAPAPGTSLTEGLHEITFTVSDNSGNESTCSFSLMVTDEQDPVIECPENQLKEAGPGCVYVLADYVALNAASDNCDQLTSVQVPAPGTPLGIGLHTIEIQATDDAGNSTSCSFEVEVVDVMAPELACNASYTFNVAACDFALPDLTADCLYSDHCEPLAVTQDVASGSFLPPGIHQITVSAEDGAGNISQAVIDVFIEDTTAPEIECVEDQSVEIDGDCLYTLSDFTGLISVANACDDLVIAQTPSPGQLMEPGTYTLSFSATDASGNTGSCVMQLEVNDAEAPDVICSGLPPVINGGCQSVMPDLTGLIEAADCQEFTIEQNPLPDTELVEGPLTITFTVTDASGNVSSCVHDVEVSLADGPGINCLPLDELTVDDCSYVLPDLTGELLINGACGPVTIAQEPEAGTIVTDEIVEITFTVTDDEGSNSCSSSLMIAYAPEIAVTCPSDLFIDQTANICGAEVSYPDPEVTTCASYELAVTSGPSSGEFFEIGLTEVTYVATLSTGAIATCSFNVTVNDLAPPEVECTEVVSGCMAVPEFTAPESFDACSPVTTEQVAGPSPGSSFDIGQTLVVWHLSDDSGNLAACSTMVEVLPLPEGSWSADSFEFCQGDAPAQLSAELTTSEEVSEWSGLSDDGYFDPSEVSPGSYEVSALLSNGSCFAAEAAEVTVHPNPQVDAGEEMAVCGMQVNLTGSTDAAEFEWLLPEGVLLLDGGNSLNPLLEAEDYTSYDIELLASSAQGCEGSDVVTISFVEDAVNFDLGEDLRVNAPAEIAVIVPSADLIEFGWLSEPGGLIEEGAGTLNLLMNDPGMYELLVTASNEPCPTRSDTLRIEVLDILIPNGFSPNGDGDNDTFSIRGLDRFSERSVRMFDRNGRLVFESENYNNEWNGTDLRGRLLPEGTYYAAIRLDELEHSGFVILERE